MKIANCEVQIEFSRLSVSQYALSCTAVEGISKCRGQIHPISLSRPFDIFAQRAGEHPLRYTAPAGRGTPFDTPRAGPSAPQGRQDTAGMRDLARAGTTDGGPTRSAPLVRDFGPGANFTNDWLI